MLADHRYAGRHRPDEVRRRRLSLTAEDVTLQIGDRRILDQVSIALEPGTFTALTGPSGAGKTTLLWVLAGALPASSGTVRYDGRTLPDHEAATREGVILLPQGVALVAPLTARENVVVPLMLNGVPSGTAHERADAALAQVRLPDSGHHLVEELSGGQQQRVGVARGLALRSSALLADEPTSELDAANREAIVGLLAAEAAAGALVLMATHDPWCAEQAGAEYHLDQGRLSRVR